MGTSESPDDTEGTGELPDTFLLVDSRKSAWLTGAELSLSRQRISFKKNGDILAGSHSWAWARIGLNMAPPGLPSV